MRYLQLDMTLKSGRVTCTGILYPCATKLHGCNIHKHGILTECLNDRWKAYVPETHPIFNTGMFLSTTFGDMRSGWQWGMWEMCSKALTESIACDTLE